MDDLANMLTGCLSTCRERGMTLPYMMVAVGINGTMIGARYTEPAAGGKSRGRVPR